MELNKNVVPMITDLVNKMEFIREREERKRAWVGIMDVLIEHHQIFHNLRFRTIIAKKLEEFAFIMHPDEDESRRIYNELVGVVAGYEQVQAQVQAQVQVQVQVQVQAQVQVQVQAQA